jgi:hypothetical protein
MARARDYLKGDASTPKAPSSSWNKEWALGSSGPYLGVVKGNIDPTKMGRLSVLIPSLANTSDPNQNQLITCEYLSPFYGAKAPEYTNGAGQGYNDSQHSYGFWAVPPDIGTKVLVIFAEGKMEQAYWIGCVQDPFTNHMTPGIASSTKTNDALDGTFSGADAGFQTDKKSKYGSTNVPSGELNRNRQGALQGGVYDSIPKPIHPLADVLLAQGLSADDIRGNTSSSARRESPSQVFGISTPGPKDTATPKVKVGAKDATLQDHVVRKIGHTFVMDDGATDGTNQLTRLRTASGHQLLMHDSAGVVYLANGSGKAFIEMDQDGTVSVYSDSGINIRSKQEFNLHSDTNINFHAKGKINFTAERDLALNAEGYLYNMGDKGVLTSSQSGSARTYAKDGITSFTSGTQLHGASGRIDLAGSQVHFNSVPARSSWGPTWLKPDHSKVGIKVTQGIIDIDGETPIANGEANKIENKTTVSEFVTHEPYDRQSSTALKRKYVNEIMTELKESNPELSSTELKVLRDELQQQESVTQVSSKLTEVIGKNKNVNLATEKLNSFKQKANEIQSLISDKLNAAIGFVYGKIDQYTGNLARFKTQSIATVKNFFRF